MERELKYINSKKSHNVQAKVSKVYLILTVSERHDKLWATILIKKPKQMEGKDISLESNENRDEKAEAIMTSEQKELSDDRFAMREYLKDAGKAGTEQDPSYVNKTTRIEPGNISLWGVVCERKIEKLFGRINGKSFDIEYTMQKEDFFDKIANIFSKAEVERLDTYSAYIIRGVKFTLDGEEIPDSVSLFVPFFDRYGAIAYDLNKEEEAQKSLEKETIKKDLL